MFKLLSLKVVRIAALTLLLLQVVFSFNPAIAQEDQQPKAANPNPSGLIDTRKDKPSLDRQPTTAEKRATPDNPSEKSRKTSASPPPPSQYDMEAIKKLDDALYGP
jgi:hypothetical protein